MLHNLLTSFFISIFIINTSFAGDILQTKKLTDNIYALIGPTTNSNNLNLGNNANFGVIITKTGVVLIDSGGTYKGAKMIHQEIKKLTDKPIILVINTGGQDHRWLGNSYFQALGAQVIANERAVIDQKNRVSSQLNRLSSTLDDINIEGTQPSYADETFKNKKSLTIGSTNIEIIHAGHAHTPGDSFVWLPDDKIIFSGDFPGKYPDDQM